MAADGSPRSGSWPTKEAVCALAPPGQCYLLDGFQAQGYGVFASSEGQQGTCLGFAMMSGAAMRCF